MNRLFLALFLISQLLLISCQPSQQTEPTKATPSPTLALKCPYEPQDLIDDALEDAPAATNISWLQKDIVMNTYMTSESNCNLQNQSGTIVIYVYPMPIVGKFGIRYSNGIADYQKLRYDYPLEAEFIIQEIENQIGETTYLKILIETYFSDGILTTNTRYYPNQP